MEDSESQKQSSSNPPTETETPLESSTQPLDDSRDPQEPDVNTNQPSLPPELLNENIPPPTGDSCKLEGTSIPTPSGNCEKLEVSKIKPVEKSEESSIPQIPTSNLKLQSSNSTPQTSKTENVEQSTSVEMKEPEVLNAPSLNKESNENTPVVDEIKVSSVNSADSKEIIQSADNTKRESSKTPIEEKIVSVTQDSLPLQSSTIDESKPTLSFESKVTVSNDVPIRVSPTTCIKDSPEPKQTVESAQKSPDEKPKSVQEVQESNQLSSTEVIVIGNASQSSLLSKVPQKEDKSLIANEPEASTSSDKNIGKLQRSHSEIKAVSTLETLERVVSSSSSFSFATQQPTESISKTTEASSPLKEKFQAAEVTTRSLPNIIVNPVDNLQTMESASVSTQQPSVSNEDVSSTVTSTTETLSSVQPLPKPEAIKVQLVQHNISDCVNLPSSQTISSSVSEVEDASKKVETLKQDVKKEVTNQQNQQSQQQQQLLKQQQQQQQKEEKEQLSNTPLLKIKDEPVDDIADSGASRFQSVLNRGSESEKSSGYDKPVQTLPICSNQSESSNVDELQSSFSQSVTHTLSFTLRQTGMPAGPVSPQPEPSKPMPNIELLGSNLKSPKSDPGCTNVVRIDVARRMSADTLSHNVVERSESRSEPPAEPSSQNVLLKQLLQNCPSAETSTPKVEDIPSVLTERIEEGISIPSSSGDKKDDKLDESGKVKKLSYLGKCLTLSGDLTIDCMTATRPKVATKLSSIDVRRAQLEKEPTPPPPEDQKVKRKRVKKKKDPAKESGSPTKKRYKKAAAAAATLKVADDGHEAFMENLMQQLRSWPPIRVLEPRIKPNFNVCSVPGAGDLNAKETCLRGTYGRSRPSSQVDFYTTQPFGSNPPTPPASLPPTPPPIRGYYNQEFPSKAKDVSLPTPPPYLDGFRPMRDTDSPDTIISSSSPECINMEQSAFTFLKLIDDDRNHARKTGRQSISPVIPLVAPIPIRALPSKIFGTDFKLEYDDLEKDKENTVLDEKPDIMMLKNRIMGMGTPPIPLKDSANVSVTLTLSSSASEDILGVLGKLADILKIPPPSTYEIVGRNVTSPGQKSSLSKKSKDPTAHIHNLLNGKPKFCCHCDIVVLSAGIRKKVSELPYLPKEEMEAAAVVSHTSDCSKQPSPVIEKLEDGDDDDDDETCDSEVKSIKEAKDKLMVHEDKDSSTTLGSLSPLTADVSTTPVSTTPVSTPQPSKVASSSPVQAMEEDKPDDAGVVTKPDETRDSQETASPIMKDDVEVIGDETERKAEKRTVSDSEKPSVKQWKGQKWRYWTIKIFSPKFRLSDKDDASDEVSRNMCVCLVPDKSLQDVRKCVLCNNVGDGETNGAARLLNMDVDKWIHLNCALWSAEVYETVNGALINVDLACKRSLTLHCHKCHQVGASLKCFRIRCPIIYHFPCAVKDKCCFFKDKTMLCAQHANRLENRDNELDSLAVLRRVYINRDEHKQIASMIQKGEQNLLRIGSLLFLNIGQLLPHQLQAFHTPNCIYPVGYKVIRMYWSMNSLSQRSQYVCSIHDVEGRPEFHVTVKGKGCDEITLKGKTPKDVWLKILEPIEKMRKEANTIKVFPNFITGDDLLGITEPAILRILESLPGVDTLSNYNFKYGRSPLLELPLAINPTGCARSEPKLRTHFKRPHTLHTRNTTSRFSMHNTLAGNEVSSPYTKQFVHSKSSQYRKMKTEWRNNVYLARSQIQGLGLYANRDIEKHTMVIEYIGQLIRNEIAERNELIYETQNRGVYMFRLDENRVIDATLCGGLARYMNHCCNPNCVAEVVQIDRENKILIIANRRITRGEELTYDYKFEVEDDQHKIQCLCGAINCRKWMN